MRSRHLAISDAQPLLDLIERRFDLRLPVDATVEHLRHLREHYLTKRKMLLLRHGEAGVLTCEAYAKAVLISETAQLLLREIDPWPRRKVKKGRPTQ